MKCQSDGLRTPRCLCLQRRSGAEGVHIAPIYALRPEVNYDYDVCMCTCSTEIPIDIDIL